MLSLLESLVSIPGTTTGYGLIKYIGPIRGKVGTFAGLELDSSIAATRGRNNGDVEGVQYFDVSIAGAGLFLPWDRLRALNPHLPANMRSLSRASSSQDQVGTPSPTSRGIKSRVSSSMGSTDRLSFGRDSPLLAAPKLQVPKRRVSSKDLHRPTQQTTRAVSLSTIASSLLGENSDKVIDALRSELMDAKALLDVKNRALMEKTAILDDLQNTVNELNPILQEYEAVVADKERKMQRQKQDYETAREEWRQSLELMLNAQLETEQLYELEISDLKLELTALMTKSNAPPKSPSKHRIIELERRVEHLTQENEKLQFQGVSSSTLDSDIEELYKRQISKLEEDVEDARHELAKTCAALKTAEDELKACKDDMERRIADDLAKRLETMAMGGPGAGAHTKENASTNSSISQGDEQLGQIRKDEQSYTDKNQLQENQIKELEKELEKFKRSQNQSPAHLGTSEGLDKLQEAHTLISELKHQLEMRPSFEELTELQNSMDEVDNLHQKELRFQEEKIAQLQKECDDLRELALADGQKLTVFPSPSDSTTNGHSSLVPMTASIAAPSLSLPILNNEDLAQLLDVYIPAQIIDASAGRDNWCGLCEREGHSSLECPYENDMF